MYQLFDKMSDHEQNKLLEKVLDLTLHITKKIDNLAANCDDKKREHVRFTSVLPIDLDKIRPRELCSLLNNQKGRLITSLNISKMSSIEDSFKA